MTILSLFFRRTNLGDGDINDIDKHKNNYIDNDRMNVQEFK